MEKVKICPQCGRKISIYTKRCIYCGRFLEKQCPHCLEYVKVEAKRCRFCGQHLIVSPRDIPKVEVSKREVRAQPTKAMVGPPTKYLRSLLKKVASPAKHLRPLLKVGIPIVAGVCFLILLIMFGWTRHQAKLAKKLEAAQLDQLKEQGYAICGELAIKATDIYNAYYRGDKSTEAWVKVRNLSKENVLLDAAYFALVIGDQTVMSQEVKEPYSLHNVLVTAGQETSAVIFFDYVELKAEIIPSAISLIFKGKWQIPLKGSEVG